MALLSSANNMLVVRLFLATLLVTTVESLQSQTLSCNRREALLGLGTLVAPTSPSSAFAAPVSTAVIPAWRLEGGVDFPRLALNTAGLTMDETERAFRNALEAGINHVEFHPGVERDGIARVLRNDKNIHRNSLFLTTKVETNWENNPSPTTAADYVRKQLDRDLSVLGTDYVDMLMLRESPDCAVVQTMWKEMEREKEEGRVRSLGVVNYCEGALKCLLSTAVRKEKPSVNYIQLHVGMGPTSAARAFGESHGIRTFAYGHLGERARPPDDTDLILGNPTLRRIALDHSKTVEDVALRWVLQSGAAASIRPTAEFILGRGVCTDPRCNEGLKASSQAFRWQLTYAEMKEIDALTSPNSNPTLFSSPGCPDSFFAKKRR